MFYYKVGSTSLWKLIEEKKQLNVYIINLKTESVVAKLEQP